MCCRAELLLNLSNKVLTEALRVLCHFIPEITQTMLKDLLFSQDPLRCISDVYHTASCCTILVCNALDQHSTELQHIQIGFFWEKSCLENNIFFIFCHKIKPVIRNTKAGPDSYRKCIQNSYILAFNLCYFRGYFTWHFLKYQLVSWS